MPEIIDLREAIRELVHDGDTIALEGFSHLVPFAAGHEIIRQSRRGLTLIRLSADIISDQLIGMGCVRKLVFSWAGNPGIGLLPRFRDAMENEWPGPLEIEEHSHAGLIAAFVAGASRLPFGLLRASGGTDLPKYTSCLAPVVCPFTGETLAAVRAMQPDIAIVHAQQADRKGNVLFWGITGIQKEAALSAKRVIVTVEEIRNELKPAGNSVILPSQIVSAIVHAPGGARPSYVHGYYMRDNEFYRAWDSIARDRNHFLAWMRENVMEGVFAESA